MKVAEAYKNIERIITFGFLSVRISINGHDLLIKNISDKEYHQMNMLCSNKNAVKANLFNLAFCTVSIDGISVLEQRNECLLGIIDFYNKSPAFFVLKITEAIYELNKTYIDSIDYLEGFSYSSKSRYLWSVLDPYNRSAFVGMRGLDLIGVNNVLENWISINKKLDEEQEYSKNLNLTLLVVGASNYKSAKMLSKNYETHTNELKELRDDISEYGYDKKRTEENDKKREEWTAPLVSREDLVRELSRQMTGQKDRHDLYIDQWMEDQKNRADRAKKNVEERQMAFRNKIESTDLDLLEPSKSISITELNKILENKKSGEPDRSYMSGGESEEIKERVLKKISTKIIRPEMKGTGNGSE